MAYAAKPLAMRRAKMCPHMVRMIGWGWANHRRVCGGLIATGDLGSRHRTYRVVR